MQTNTTTPSPPANPWPSSTVSDKYMSFGPRLRAGPHPPAPPDPGEDDFEVPADEGAGMDQGSNTRAPMVRTALVSGRVLFDDSLSWWVTISSYLGMS